MRKGTWRWISTHSHPALDGHERSTSRSVRFFPKPSDQEARWIRRKSIPAPLHDRPVRNYHRPQVSKTVVEVTKVYHWNRKDSLRLFVSTEESKFAQHSVHSSLLPVTASEWHRMNRLKSGDREGHTIYAQHPPKSTSQNLFRALLCLHESGQGTAYRGAAAGILWYQS